ncbi:hypothetical protein, partial [Pandoraea pneumonica]|uniref:hypothetical protein n=1 Tax=Pandoraea pneumonica TaxID=2508299 RepID=UPI003CEBEFEB
GLGLGVWCGGWGVVLCAVLGYCFFLVFFGVYFFVCGVFFFFFLFLVVGLAAIIIYVGIWFLFF